MELDHPIWRFAAVGAGNTVASLALIYGTRALGAGEVSANAAGYAFGLVLSFSLNRGWTFGHYGSVLSSASKFLLVMFLGWLTNLVALLALMRWGAAGAWAQAGGVLPYALISYFGCRWWVFAPQPSPVEEIP